MALAGLVIGTGRRIAGNLGWLTGDIVCIAGSVIFTFPEAVTAGLIRHLRVTAAYMDVVFAAAVIFVIRTIYN